MVLMVLSQTLPAQKGGMHFGIKLGPNFSSWSGEDAEPFDDAKKKMLIGPHFGVFMTIPITTMLSLQPELLYSMQGVKYSYSDGYKETYRTNHLNVPIALRIHTPGGFYAIVGPQVGFSLGGKYKYEEDGDEGEEDLEDLKGVQFSGVLGFGYQLPNGFGVYARYAHTFSSPFDVVGEKLKIHNSMMMLSFFYMMRLNK